MHPDMFSTGVSACLQYLW